MASIIAARPVPPCETDTPGVPLGMHLRGYLFAVAMSLTGCVGSGGTSSSSDDSSSPVVDHSASPANSTDEADAIAQSNAMAAATQVANDAAQAQANAAQADAMQTMINANNSAPSQ